MRTTTTTVSWLFLVLKVCRLVILLCLGRGAGTPRPRLSRSRSSREPCRGFSLLNIWFQPGRYYLKVLLNYYQNSILTKQIHNYCQLCTPLFSWNWYCYCQRHCDSVLQIFKTGFTRSASHIKRLQVKSLVFSYFSDCNIVINDMKLWI